MSDPLRADWLQHEHTRKLRGAAERVLELRRLDLMAACAASTDAAVTKRLAEYRAQETLVQLLKGTPDDGPSGSGQGAARNAGE